MGKQKVEVLWTLELCYPALKLRMFPRPRELSVFEVTVKAKQTDICVVGGGPAGSMLAAQLAAVGHSVVLVERAEFPRRHLGESLTPGVRSLLQASGAGDVLNQAGASTVESVLVNWDGGLRERTDPEAKGMLVDRRSAAETREGGRRPGATTGSFPGMPSVDRRVPDYR